MNRLPVLLVLAATSLSLNGCSFFVMGGKMLFGDPRQPSAFRQATGVRLADQQQTVLVVCSAPETVKVSFPGLSYDVTDGLIRQLKRRGIDVVDPDRVADWLDDHGGSWGHPSELAEQFHPDYIIHVQVDHFTTQEEHSPSLRRGQVGGTVFAYEVQKDDGRRDALEVFVREFHSTYPRHHPISADQMSASVFRRRQLDRLCDRLGQFFYDYRVSEQIQ